ncbi:MAG: FadR family transcriptional regulator [Proteobacteria bacterium]|nr:FadR family transcriptional regulator [Pseudomonadota bacterium]
MKADFQPVARRRLSDDIVDQIKTMILERDLRPGERLPSERDLVDMFRVGRTPIREAIRTLDILGVLDVRAGHGVFVKEPDVNSYLKNMQESLNFLVELEKKTFIEILDVRQVLESHTAALAAKNATKDDLSLLEKTFQDLLYIQRAYEKAPTEANARNWIEADFNFHKFVAQCSHNGVLEVMITSIKTLVHRSSRKLLSLPDLLELAQDFINEHKQVMEAVKSGSSERASQAMTDHLNHAQEVMSRLIVSRERIDN